MSDPEGNSESCFPKSPDVSRDEVEGNIRTRGKTKLTGFLRDVTLRLVFCYIFLEFHSNVLQQQQKNTLKRSESKQYDSVLIRTQI